MTKVAIQTHVFDQDAAGITLPWWCLARPFDGIVVGAEPGACVGIGEMVFFGRASGDFNDGRIVVIDDSDVSAVLE